MLPGSDRLEALLAAGAATDVNVTVVDAMLPEEIPAGDLPKVSSHLSLICPSFVSPARKTHIMNKSC